jgi:hypothetical protein
VDSAADTACSAASPPPEPPLHPATAPPPNPHRRSAGVSAESRGWTCARRRPPDGEQHLTSSRCAGTSRSPATSASATLVTVPRRPPASSRAPPGNGSEAVREAAMPGRRSPHPSQPGQVTGQGLRGSVYGQAISGRTSRRWTVGHVGHKRLSPPARPRLHGRCRPPRRPPAPAARPGRGRRRACARGPVAERRRQSGDHPGGRAPVGEQPRRLAAGPSTCWQVPLAQDATIGALVPVGVIARFLRRPGRFVARWGPSTRWR